MTAHYFKLSCGDDVIATVTNVDADRFVITEPVIIVCTQNPMSGSMMVSYVPWVPSLELFSKEMNMWRTNVMMDHEITDMPGMSKNYEHVVIQIKQLAEIKSEPQLLNEEGEGMIEDKLDGEDDEPGEGAGAQILQFPGGPRILH